MSGPHRLLLGPLVEPGLPEDWFARLPPGPLAVISAGWQEEEGDHADLAEQLGRPLEDLELYRRAEALFRSDQALWEAYRERQERLIELQRLYRLRLRHLARAARQVLGANEDPAALAPEQRHAVAQLKALDRHHFQRTEAIQQEFSEAYHPDRHGPLSQAAAELAAQIQRSAGVLIAGGNVLVLLNRIRLFGIERWLANVPLAAWSAGAMVLAERIVLFHERSPQGRREAELMGSGLGLLPGYVFLPDARRRLRTGDTLRLGLLGRRFAPDRCLSLDPGNQVRFDGDTLVDNSGARRLTRSGRFDRVRTP